MVRRSSHTSLLRDFSHSTLCTSSPARAPARRITPLPGPAATCLPCLPKPQPMRVPSEKHWYGGWTQRGQNMHQKLVIHDGTIQNDFTGAKLCWAGQLLSITSA